MPASVHLHFEPSPVYFMHLGKTAGRSLSTLLASAYKGRDVVWLKVPNALTRVTLAELKRYRCYLAHFGPGLFTLVDRSELVCITMLRDPVELTVSRVYFHQQRLARFPQQFTPEYVARMQPWIAADLRTWLETAELTDQLQDVQTRTLGIARDYRAYLRDGAIGSTGISLLRPFRAPALTEEHDMTRVTENAKRWLERMAVVGITERFAESVELICALLGLPMPAQLPQANIGPRKRGVDTRGYRATTPPDLIERMEALTRYDQELYGYACELFEQQLARHRARPRRSYSIAPRLRMAVRRVRSRAKQYL